MVKASRRVIAEARKLVKARDDFRCQMCGRIFWTHQVTVHHRLNKGRGGSAKLERASVLITACGDGTRGCHGKVTQNPDWARSIRWLLPRNNPAINPELEPILLWDGWFLLSDDGSRTPCAPPNEVGA